jgi:hypothetical protein
MGLFTIAGGVGCMLAPGLQFNAVMEWPHMHYRVIFFLTAGVVIIKVGVSMLITNQWNRENISGSNLVIRSETVNLINSSATIQKDFRLSVCGFL